MPSKSCSMRWKRQRWRELVQEMADRGQGILAREERPRRIVLADGLRKRGALGEGEVRGIGEGQIEGPASEGREPVGGCEIEAGQDAVPPCVGARKGQRFQGGVER